VEQVETAIFKIESAREFTEINYELTRPLKQRKEDWKKHVVIGLLIIKQCDSSLPSANTRVSIVSTKFQILNLSENNSLSGRRSILLST